MTPRARLFVALSVALAAIASTAAADPITIAVRLAAQDAGGGSGGAAKPATPKPTTTPMLADVAGTAKPIGLPELLQQTIATSPSLALANIDIEVARANIDAAGAWADWGLQIEASGSSRKAGGAFSRTDSAALAVDLSRRISTGGTVSLHADTGYTRQDFAFMGAGGETRSLDSGVRIGILQPLLRGRGNVDVDFNARIVRTQLNAAQIAEQAAAIAIVQSVVTSYLDLIAAERDLEIRRSSLELAQERLKVTMAGIDKGGVAKAETIPVEQAIATREESVLAGELAILDTSLGLRRSVGMAIEPGDMLLSSTVDLAIPAKTWNQQALVDAAIASSPDMARLAALAEGATIQVEATENGLLPVLDLSASLGPTFIVDDPTGARDTSTGYQAALTLTYQQALGKTSAKAAVRVAKAQRETIRINRDDLRKQIVSAVAVAVAAIQVAERRYTIAVRAVDLAEQNLAVEQARLGLGKSRNVDVLQRQDELRAAQLSAARAIIDWHRADAVIAGLTGEILPRYGITIDAGAGTGTGTGAAVPATK
ncbi:MAG TPA: TolC family protein [Kofleriaceae bacterium]|nr:TolC family protein [Kofleriaceae bacterium]